LSVPILRELINRVIYPDFSPWTSLMVHLITRLHDYQLKDLATEYEIELMEHINNSPNRYLDEQSLETLAVHYINNSLQEKGFALVSQIQDSGFKQGVCRRLYTSYEASNRLVAEQAYQLGIELL